jgi:hypothetical protein
MISSHGTPTTRPGFQSSISVFGASRFAASTRASMSTTVSLASSAGWPSRKPPMASQLLVLAAVPAPVPTPGMNNAASNKTLKAYSGHVSHSSIRIDACEIAQAPSSEMKNQMTCCFHKRVT